MKKLTDWVLVGNVGVDAGLIWIGDPCYVIKDKDEDRYPEFGKDWAEFCDLLGEECPTIKQFGRGLGMAISSGFGDGGYNVYVKYSDEGKWGKRVAEAKVVFIQDEDEDDYDSSQD